MPRQFVRQSEEQGTVPKTKGASLGKVFTRLLKGTAEIPSGNASPITVNTGTAWDSHPGIGEGLSDSDSREQSRIREVKYRFVHAARPISRRGLREQQTAVG